MPEFLKRLQPALAALTEDYEILFALDPSPDRTEAVILEHRARDERIKLLRFSRRFGKKALRLSDDSLKLVDDHEHARPDVDDVPHESLQPAVVRRRGIAARVMVLRTVHEPFDASIGQGGPLVLALAAIGARPEPL